CARALFDYW
nr:immunoglobulin heavy chain junction region [Mus musculus]